MKLSNDPGEDKARKAAAAAALALLGLAGLQHDPKTFTVGSRLDALVDQPGAPAPGGITGRGGAPLPGVRGIMERAFPGGIGRGRRNGTFLLPLQANISGGSWHGTIDQILIGGGADTPSTADHEYNSLWGGHNWVAAAAEDVVSQIIPTPGALHTLDVKLSAAPGVGKSYTFRVYVNTAPTGLFVTISDNETRGTLLTSRPVVSPFDRVNLRCSPTGAPNATNARWSVNFTPDDPQEIAILAGVFPSATDTIYIPLQQGLCTGENTDNKSAPMPCSGILKDMRVLHMVAPGLTRNEEWTLRVNGADSGLSCFVYGALTQNSNLAIKIRVNRGDMVCWQGVPTNNPVCDNAYISCVFVPDTAWKQVITGTADDGLSTNLTEYNQLACGYFNLIWNASEAARRQGIRGCWLHSLIVVLTVAPGAGKNRVFTVFRNGIATTLQATISDTDTVGEDITHWIQITDIDEISLETAPTGAPVLARASWGALIN